MLQNVQPSKRKQMLIELIGFTVLILWSMVVLKTFMVIGDYIRNNNNNN